MYQYQFRLWRLTGPRNSLRSVYSLREEEAVGVDCVTLMPSITPSFPILGPSFRKAERCAAKGCAGGLAQGREAKGRDGIKARKSSVSKMNGSGIDDAEGARARERGYRKICRARRVPVRLAKNR